MTGARYRQIADELRERLALGDLGAGGSLESEAGLGSRYDASRMTIRKSLELLRDEGLIEARQGAGWFASTSVFHQQLALGTFRHAASAVESAGQQLARRVVSFAFEPCPESVGYLLGVPTGADMLHVRSVRSADGEPLDRATEWVTADLAAEFSRSDAASPGIWRCLERSGTAIATVRQTITAGVAGALDNELIGATAGSALLLVRRLALGADGIPIALSDHRYLAHRFSLEVEFHGSSPGDVPPGLHQLAPTPTPHPGDIS